MLPTISIRTLTFVCEQWISCLIYASCAVKANTSCATWFDDSYKYEENVLNPKRIVGHLRQYKLCLGNKTINICYELFQCDGKKDKQMKSKERHITRSVV